LPKSPVTITKRPVTFVRNTQQGLNEAIGLVVREGKIAGAAAAERGLTDDVAPGIATLLADELAKLEMFNCSRVRLIMSATADWIAAGRPQ
jgi:hypothetical protein